MRSYSLCVESEEPFRDARGELQVLLRDKIASVTRITSLAGTRRADHWHREDSHLCYVERGLVKYLERAVGSSAAPVAKLFAEGDMFFTGPNVEHSMEFLEDSVLYCFANRDRTQSDYETDLVRLAKPLVEQD